jgi:hypothetical protein
VGDRAMDLALLFLNVHTKGDRLGSGTDPALAIEIGKRGHTVSSSVPAHLAYQLAVMLTFVATRNPKHIAGRTHLAHRVLDAFERLPN